MTPENVSFTDFLSPALSLVSVEKRHALAVAFDCAIAYGALLTREHVAPGVTENALRMAYAKKLETLRSMIP